MNLLKPMKIVRIGLYLLTLYILIYRPPLFSANVSNKHVLPLHVNSFLGSAAQRKLKGIDISHFDGQVDFNQLQQSGIEFVYLKATQGSEYVDPTYHAHVEKLNSTNILRGAYHFYEPAEDAKAQAIHFLNVVAASNNTLPPMLDVEITQGKSAEAIKKGVQTWLATVEKELGCRPVLYSYADFWRENLGVQFNNYPFWLADYSSKPDVPHDLKNWRLWQYSDKGRVHGIDSHVDLDVMVTQELHCRV